MGRESLSHPNAISSSGQVTSVEMPSLCDSQAIRAMTTTDFKCHCSVVKAAAMASPRRVYYVPKLRIEVPAKSDFNFISIV